MHTEPTAIPYGYCHCGCGQRTTVSDTTRPRFGWVKGEPKRFACGHSSRTKVHGQPYEMRDCGYKTPCWVWTAGTRGRSGYGCLNDAKGRTMQAHRVYYERHVGLIPHGLELDHLCRVRACVNPTHLEPVTTAENQRRGLNTKLTVEQAREIYRRVHAGALQIPLAAEYGISQGLVSNIKLGKSWTDIAQREAHR